MSASEDARGSKGQGWTYDDEHTDRNEHVSYRVGAEVNGDDLAEFW